MNYTWEYVKINFHHKHFVAQSKESCQGYLVSFYVEHTNDNNLFSRFLFCYNYVHNNVYFISLAH